MGRFVNPDNSASVSYTHLDVYKRQQKYGCTAAADRSARDCFPTCKAAEEAA